MMVGFLSQQSSKTKSVNEDIQGHTLVLFYLMYSKLRCYFLNRNSIKRIHILAKTMSNICIKIANSYKQDMFQRGRLYQTCKLSYMPLKDATWQNWKQRWYQGSNGILFTNRSWIYFNVTTKRYYKTDKGRSIQEWTK